MDDTEETGEFIAVETAADILKMTPRQVNRYGNERRIRIRRAGRRVLYLRDDVESLADELGVALRPNPRPKTDLVPAGQMLDYIRERDRRLDEMQAQLLSAAAEIGRLNGLLEQQRLLGAANEDLKQQNEALIQRVRDLEAQMEQVQQQAQKDEKPQRRRWKIW